MTDGAVSVRSGDGMADFPIFSGYTKQASEAFNGQDVVNLFLIDSPQGKKKLAYLGTPGLKEELQLMVGGQPARELFILGDYMYGGFGASIYRFDKDLIPTYIASIDTASGYLSIEANNNHQIGFVDGQSGYTYNTTTNVFSQITAPGFPPRPLNLGFLDGYGIIPSGESVEFQVSAFNDLTKWSALDEAPIQSYQGLNVGVGIVNRRVFFFKNQSTDVWYNAGSADFPLRPDRNLLFNYGALCTSSIKSGFGYLFWLSNDADGVGSVMVTEGNAPRRISNDAVDDLISSFTAPEDMDAYIYKENGRIFYQMSWTTDDVTIFYDLKMNAWYRKAMLKRVPIPGQPYSGKVRHLSNCHAYFNGQHIVGSYKDSKVFSMSRDYPTNAGEPMERKFITGHVFDPENNNMLQINKIQLNMQQGLGESGIGTGIYEDSNDDPLINPQVYLALSRDGGESYGNGIPAPIGKIGQTKMRTIWRKKGQARDLVGDFTILAPIRNICITGATIDVKVLSK